MMSLQHKWLRRPWRWPVDLLLFSFLMTEAVAQLNNTNHSCYYPSGVISPGKPCRPNAKNSVCCGPGFECLDNGLCQISPLIDTPYKFTLYRSACTDPTFQDPACPHFCIGADDNPQAGQGMQVCSLELGTYCCKRDYDCCTNSTLVYALGSPEIINIIPNHTAHPTHPSVTAPTHTATPQEDARQSTAYARNTIIGVGIGLAVLMAILVLGCCFWLWRARPSERYRDRKRGVFEMDKLDDSRSAIHKDSVVSVSQPDTPSPPIETDAPTQFELNTRRATMINQVVEMFELDASPSSVDRRAEDLQTQGTLREGPSWEGNTSSNGRAPDDSILEASPVLATVDSRRLSSSRSRSRISGVQMAATTTRPLSEFTPVTERIPTPLPDSPELGSFGDMPPIPASPPTMSLPETLNPAIRSPGGSTARSYTGERAPPAKSYDVWRRSETIPPRGLRVGAEDLTRPGFANDRAPP